MSFDNVIKPIHNKNEDKISYIFSGGDENHQGIDINKTHRRTKTTRMRPSFLKKMSMDFANNVKRNLTNAYKIDRTDKMEKN